MSWFQKLHFLIMSSFSSKLWAKLGLVCWDRLLLCLNLSWGLTERCKSTIFFFFLTSRHWAFVFVSLQREPSSWLLNIRVAPFSPGFQSKDPVLFKFFLLPFSLQFCLALNCLLGSIQPSPPATCILQSSLASLFSWSFNHSYGINWLSC